MFTEGRMNRMYDVFLIIRDVNNNDAGEYTVELEMGGVMMQNTLMLTSKIDLKQLINYEYS